MYAFGPKLCALFTLGTKDINLSNCESVNIYYKYIELFKYILIIL